MQELLDPLLPLVDRAEKNANTVVSQQKILTQVGQALRAINRQSADLLETAADAGLEPELRHLAATEAAIGRPELRFDLPELQYPARANCGVAWNTIVLAATTATCPAADPPGAGRGPSAASAQMQAALSSTIPP